MFTRSSSSLQVEAQLPPCHLISCAVHTFAMVWPWVIQADGVSVVHPGGPVDFHPRAQRSSETWAASAESLASSGPELVPALVH
eukprot:COSAG01_NODE_3705_length_5777_cov_19.676118_4_plen_84_part_00